MEWYQWESGRNERVCLSEEKKKRKRKEENGWLAKREKRDSVKMSNRD